VPTRIVSPDPRPSIVPTAADPAAIPGASPGQGLSRLAIVTFIVLASMNLMDYMDRNVLSAVLPQVQDSLRIKDEQAGKLATAFLLTYSLVGPVMGYAADRYRRTWLLALGVGVWALATMGSGLATDYDHLWYARCLLGVGEATYGVIAPTMLMDLFSRQSRSRVMSAFYVAMPVGSALGMVIGGAMAPWPAAARVEFLLHWFGSGLGQTLASFEGWQLAFFLVGLPALLSVAVALFLPEPVRGASEGVDEAKLAAHQRQGPTWHDYHDLMVNSSYTYSVLGMTAYTFAIGGLLIWFPSFLFTTRGLEQQSASAALGILTASAAIMGMTSGGWLADVLARRDTRALFLVPGAAMLMAVPPLLVALFARDKTTIFVAIFAAEFLMFVNTGPCNAIIGHVVQPNMRAVALAVAIAVLHFLGDIWSPWLIGLISDRFGSPAAMSGTIGSFLAWIGAEPTTVPGRPGGRNLLAGLLIVVPAVVLSGLVLLSGARHLPREMALMQAKLRASKAAPVPTS
jgi:MFS family permease